MPNAPKTLPEPRSPTDPAYETDSFSRNDRAGAPSREALETAIDEQAEFEGGTSRQDVRRVGRQSGGTSSARAAPDASRKAADDADSRDAAPEPPATGGVT